MAATGGRRMKALTELFLVAATGCSVYYFLSYILKRLEGLDPDKADREELARRSNAVLRRIDENDPANRYLDTSSSSKRKGKGARERLTLSSYEQKIVTEVVAPEDIKVSFADIGGLDGIIDELRESVIYPLTAPHLFAGHSSLLAAPKGVLLYGPPGCGKTMLAKALAKESGACFINLHISTLTEKWYGDSNKMVAAVFSLARKLQPAIIFIDEIDAVLRARSATDHEASAMVKAEFMTHWDGLLTGTATSSVNQTNRGSTLPGTASQIDEEDSPRIMVLGATNRIHDIDEAILRRLPKKFPIHLPDATQRERILRLILKDTRLDADFSYDALVRATAGFSGSDLKEACRDAAMVPVREMIRESGIGRGGVAPEKGHVRGVRNADFFRKESGGKEGSMGFGMGWVGGAESGYVEGDSEIVMD